MRKAVGYVAMTLVLCGVLGVAVGACGGGDVSSETSASLATTLGEVATSEMVDTTVDVTAGGPASLDTRVDSALLGTWYCEQLRETISFGPTGTMTSVIGDPAETEFTFPYRVEGTTIYLIENGLVVPVFDYSVDDDVLTLVDVDSGAADEYQRVR